MTNAEILVLCPRQTGTMIFRDGRPVSYSRNLRGLLEYARRPISPVTHATVERDPESGSNVRGRVIVHYADGAATVAYFASYHIAVDWVRNRRTWRRDGVILTIAENTGYLTKPGIIGGMA